MTKWHIEVSTEVERWYGTLRPRGLAQADRAFDRLREYGPSLSMPHSRLLGEGLRELRFTCQDQCRRITYYIDGSTGIITLTAFAKQRDNDRREVRRARLRMEDRKGEEDDY